MNDNMVSRYLQVLGCENAAAVSEENLFLLHEKHLANIPYTNYQIYFNARTPDLDPEAVFERIVIQRQGGYCFELNGLFADLLRSLGYGVTEYFARWHAGENCEIPMRRHRVAAVECSGKRFLADVGVGCLISSTPLEFTPDIIQKKNRRDYRIVEDPYFGYLVQADSEEGFYTLYSFAEENCPACDFEYVNFYCSQHTDSPFRRKLFLHRQGHDFRVFLENPTPESPVLSFCEMYGDSVKRETVTSALRLREIFEKEFGITYGEETFAASQKMF